MTKNLLLWGYPIQSVAEIEPQGIPIESSGVIGISEQFNPKKTHPDFDYPWVVTYTPGPMPPMPNKVYVCIKKLKAVNFDFIPYGDFLLISESLLSFLEEQGFDYTFDRSQAERVNTKGQTLTEEKFYLLRKDDQLIQEEVEWLEGDVSLGEYSQVITHSDKGVFLSDEDGYESCLLVDENLKETLEQRFRAVFLYTVADWNSLNDDGWDF